MAHGGKRPGAGRKQGSKSDPQKALVKATNAPEGERVIDPPTSDIVPPGEQGRLYVGPPPPGPDDLKHKRLNTAYVLKESFGQLWSYEREGWARRFFENWRSTRRDREG